MAFFAGNDSTTAPAGLVSIGAEIRRAVFRDPKTYYANDETVRPAPRLLAFARKHAGPSILDLGCARGGICLALSGHGFRVQGADLNPEYVRIARERGVDARLIAGRLPFADAEFDSVLLFEVLEHAADPHAVLSEAKRIARKNVLMTVPNRERHKERRQRGLLFEHFADLAHRQFYTARSLRELLAAHFVAVRVTRGDPLNPLALVGNRRLRFAARAAWRIRLIRPRYNFRLYAVAAR